VADKAEGHLQKALAYVLALPPWLHGLRLACIWPKPMRSRRRSRGSTRR